MFFRINTITKSLFFSFGILVFNIVVIALLSLFFLWRTRTISKISQRIDNQRILTMQLLKTDLDFLRFETVNQNFYETGRSNLLREHDSLFHVIKMENKALHTTMVAYRFLIDYQFNTIDSILTKYHQTFQTLIRKINQRGFKDYGLEGVMRGYAHQLENKEPAISTTEILSLRRHEKDFLLRKEYVYIEKFNALADTLHAFMQRNDYRESAEILNLYQQAFNRLTRLNYELGIVPTEGLLGSLNVQADLISDSFQQLTQLSAQRTDKVVVESAIWFSVVSGLTILLSMALTYYTSTRLARPIKKLSHSISKFIVNEGLNETELENPEISSEIINLSQSFIKLSRKLKAQFGEIQKQNRALKKLNEELDRFIYSAAHDLKSPLASLDGLVGLAEKEINSPAHNHYFRMMHSTLKKLDGFIRDITDYAKNKRQQLKLEHVDLQLLLTDIFGGLRFLPNADRVKINIHVDGSEFITDRTRLEIILKNLLSNSFRYMDPDKADSFIRIEGVVSENIVRVTITDNGIGIGKDHLPKIFDMFYRAVEHSQGTGIGLFLVKESVKMLRGKISVKSNLGEWTTFYLSVPNFREGEVNIPESDAVEVMVH